MIEARVFTQTTEFAYNGLGARLAVSVEGYGTTLYTLDYAAGNRILAESTPTETVSYLYPSASLGTGGHDCLGEQREGELALSGAEGWLYYLHDAEGYVRQGVDADGQIVSAWLFDPDGTVLEGPNGPVSHLVCGGVYDGSTGLIYRDGGYFDPNLGIWLALIPLLVVQGWRKRKDRRQWVLLVCVGLFAVGSLAGCSGGGGTPICTPTGTPGWGSGAGTPGGGNGGPWPGTGTPTPPSPTPTLSPTPDRGAPPDIGPRPPIPPSPTPTPDLDEEDALARMLYGEQKHEPRDNIIAAGWTVRNRIAIGYRGLSTYKAQVENGEYQGIITPQQRDALPPGERQYFEEHSKVIAKGVIDNTIGNSMEVENAIFFSNTSSTVQRNAYEALLNDPEGPVGPGNWGFFGSNLPNTTFFYYRNKAGIYPTAIPVP